MAESIPDTGAISDTIVVAGDEYSDETHDESLTDGSIYGEEEDPEARAQPAAATASPAAEATAPTDSIPKAEAEAQAEAEDNDYAKSFDSPPRHQSPKETEEAHPDDDDDVSPPPTAETSESIMNTSQSHPHPRSAVTKSPSPPPGLPLTNGSAPGPVPDSTATVLESKSLPLPPSSPSSPINATANAPTAAPSEELIRALVASASATAAAAAAASSGADTTPNKVTAATAPALSDIEDDGAVDIQKLVDDITRRASSTAASSPSNPSAVTTTTTNLPAPPTTTSAPALPASLPPKPSLPKIPPQPHAFHSAATIPIASPTTPHGNYMSASAPGTGNDPISSLPAPPHTAYANQPHGQSHAQSTVQNSYNMNGPPDAFHNASNQRAWETFLADENRYTSEQNWDRFPEGSRIFIGNLSSDRVSKREVFTYFSRFGRLAQISLKSAYGFVQYHTIAEGQACLQGAQGIEMGGRKIHLEISRAQKKKDKEDREKPPDRQNFHGARERFDNRNQGHASGQGWKRDDYRPAGRSPSPRRYDGRGSRDGFYPRERGFGSMSGTHDRRRSQSPARHNRQGNDYRRRSPSPHRRTSSPALDLPRRYGQDVPDVQIILLQEVSRGFVTWVQGSLHNRGLRTDVMYLNPRFPRQMVVERQALEGVHAIIDLDYATEAQGKINMQLFIRAPGTTIRFEEYRAIDPPIAAELVLREKTKPFHSQPQQQPGGPVYPPQNNNGYGTHYPTEAPAVPAPYQQYPQTAGAPLPPHAPPAPGASAPDLSTLIGQFNNNALQSLLATLQPQQQQQQSHYGMAPAVLTPQVGVNSILSNLQNAQLPTQPNVYGGGPQMAAYAGGGNNPVDAAQHVQSILKNLKRSAD